MSDVLYLANPSTPGVREAMSAKEIGCMATPAQGNKIGPSWTWAADNGCFNDGWKAGKWVSFLDKSTDKLATCLFAVVPDKVADATETLRLWKVWSPVVNEMGYPAAFVLQDGASVIPWDEMACLFIGGSTDYKLSPEAERFALEARARGKWVHWGRVNSRRRYGRFATIGDSCDGTYLAFGPDVNLPRLQGWLSEGRLAI